MCRSFPKHTAVSVTLKSFTLKGSEHRKCYQTQFQDFFPHLIDSRWRRGDWWNLSAVGPQFVREAALPSCEPVAPQGWPFKLFRPLLPVTLGAILSQLQSGAEEPVCAGAVWGAAGRQAMPSGLGAAVPTAWMVLSNNSKLLLHRQCSLWGFPFAACFQVE